MKKILLMICLGLLVGCSNSPAKVNYAEMDSESIYQDLLKKEQISTILDTVYINIEKDGISGNIKAEINVEEGAQDLISYIDYYYSNDNVEESFVSGYVYFSDPRGRYDTANGEVDETVREAYLNYLKDDLNMTEDQLKELLIYSIQTYSLPGDEWVDYAVSKEESFIESQKKSTSVCTFADEWMEDSLTMISGGGSFIEEVSWITTFNDPNEDVVAYVDQQKSSFEGITGLEFDVSDSAGKLTTTLNIKYFMINQSDLEKVGLVTSEGEGTSFGVSVDASIKGFEAEGYTCNTVRE